MKNKFFSILAGAACSFFILTLAFSTDSFARAYKFSGGPSGGTFQYYASAISSLENAKSKVNGFRILASSSGGSIENIRNTNSGRTNFAVAYSGQVYQARNGMLTKDTKKYEDVRAVAYLYGAPAQLIVRANSGITKTSQLKGKRVGVGNAGSGAAANCELFFKELGIWDDVQRNFLGYRQAAEAFKNKQLDAFWVFVGFPNASVIEAALQNDIRLINTYKDAEEINMFNKYPYFAKVIIPANTYKGVAEETVTFQDSTLWIANKDVPDDVIYKMMADIFSTEGLAHMLSVHKSAKEMSIENGIKGIVTPLHSGAEKFWKEKGIIE